MGKQKNKNTRHKTAKMEKTCASCGTCTWFFKKDVLLVRLLELNLKMVKADMEKKYIDIHVDHDTEESLNTITLSFVLEEGENLYTFGRETNSFFKEVVGVDFFLTEAYKVEGFDISGKKLGSDTTLYVH